VLAISDDTTSISKKWRSLRLQLIFARPRSRYRHPSLAVADRIQALETRFALTYPLTGGSDGGYAGYSAIIPQ